MAGDIAGGGVSGGAKNHFFALDVAFTLLLLIEVASLIFGLERSVSSAVGKQIEIFSPLGYCIKHIGYSLRPFWQHSHTSIWPVLPDQSR